MRPRYCAVAFACAATRATAQIGVCPGAAAIARVCHPDLAGVCCWPITPGASCELGCTSAPDACAEGCSRNQTHATAVGPMEICCVAAPPHDVSPPRLTASTIALVSLALLFLTLCVLSVVRANNRLAADAYQADGGFVRTDRLKHHDEALLGRRRDRSVWRRHWGSGDAGAAGVGSGGDGSDDDDGEGGYEDCIEWSRFSSSNNSGVYRYPTPPPPLLPSGAAGAGEEGGAGGGAGRRSLPIMPPAGARHGRKRSVLRKRGWVRHFAAAASDRDEVPVRSSGIPQLLWRDASVAAGPAARDPVNAAPSAALRAELRRTERLVFSEKCGWLAARLAAQRIPPKSGELRVTVRRCARVAVFYAQRTAARRLAPSWFMLTLPP